MIELLFIEGNPAGVKAMLSIMNICQNNLRLPLVPVSRTIYTRIQKAWKRSTKADQRFGIGSLGYRPVAMP